jgi:hypothetical protein
MVPEEAPVLDTETVMLDVPEPPVTGFVPKLAEMLGGVTADSITLSEKPVMAVMVINDESEPPGGIVREDGAAAMVKSGGDTIT